jgi:peroxiredoxin
MAGKIPISVLMAVLLFFALSCAAQGPILAGDSPADAEQMMAWRFDRAGGGKMSLREFSSKLTILTFFTTWAPSSIAQIEALSHNFGKYSARGLMVVGVSMDLNRELTVELFVKQFNVPFPIAYAGDAVFKGTSPFGRITTVPSSFIFDDEGRLVRAFIGLIIPEDELQRLIEKHVL